MRKWLAIFALLLTISPFMAGQPDKAANRKQQPAAQSQPSVIPADGTNKQASGETDQTKPNPDPPEWYTPLERPDWWLVIVAALTGGVIGWQAWETRKAAQGAKANALAAMSQIRLIREKERARLRIEMIPFEGEPIQMFGTTIYLVNFKVVLEGTTPAYILEHKSFAALFPVGTEPSEPDFMVPMDIPAVVSSKKKPIKAATFLQTSTTKHTMETVAKRIENVKAGKLGICCIGWIRYEDVFGGRWKICFKRKWTHTVLPESFGGDDLGGNWVNYGALEENGEEEERPEKAN